MTIYKGSRYEYSTVDYVATEEDGPENLSGRFSGTQI